MTGGVDLAHAMDVARRAVEAASAAALRRFRRVDAEIKADGSPVTIADREAEAAILELVRREFPDHGVLAEESGAAGEGAPWRWIVDPLDGTRQFVRGAPFWGPLVALEHGGEIVAGAMALPVMGEVYAAARGLGCWDRDGRRVRLADAAAWDQAVICVGRIDVLAERPAFAALTASAWCAWCPGDLGGGAYVLSGRAHVWIEDGVALWDVAPFKVLVEEAGGRCTNLCGAPDLAAGNILAGTPSAHAHVLGTVLGN